MQCKEIRPSSQENVSKNLDRDTYTLPRGNTNVEIFAEIHLQNVNKPTMMLI